MNNIRFGSATYKKQNINTEAPYTANEISGKFNLYARYKGRGVVGRTISYFCLGDKRVKKPPLLTEGVDWYYNKNKEKLFNDTAIIKLKEFFALREIHKYK